MGKKLEDIPRIKGWGHNTARLRFDDKVAESRAPSTCCPTCEHGHRRDGSAPASKT